MRSYKSIRYRSIVNTVEASPNVVNSLGSISENIIPTANSVYNLGSESNRWKDLYLSGQTINLGDTKIQQSEAGDVKFLNQDDAPVKIRVSELEIGDSDEGPTIKISKSPGGSVQFAEVSSTGVVAPGPSTDEFTKSNSYASIGAFPSANNRVGDVAILSTTNEVYIWGGSAWSQVPNDTDGTKVATLRQEGELVLTTGTARWYASRPITVQKIIARVDTASSGSAVSVSVKKNGSAIRNISISSGSNKSVNTNSFSLSEDDYITVDVTAIGSSTAGSDLSVALIYK